MPEDTRPYVSTDVKKFFRSEETRKTVTKGKVLPKPLGTGSSIRVGSGGETSDGLMVRELGISTHSTSTKM